MQRLFSTFANGWPGKGLLIQRVLAAAIAAYCLLPDVGTVSTFSTTFPQWIAAGAALLLLIGLWTPVAGTALAVLEFWLALSHAGDPRLHGILAILGATLAMIGPGAWSLDAHLFGRKHFEISNR